MKRLVSLCILCLMFLLLCGCQNSSSHKVEKKVNKNVEDKATLNQNEDIKQVEKEEEEKPMVDIKYNINGFTIFDDNRTIVLNPEIKNIKDDNIQYHWTLEGGTALAFYNNAEPTNEIINSGSLVSIGIVEEISYIDTNVVINYKVKLDVENKSTGEVIASKAIVIQDKAGTYSVQEIE